MSRDKAIEAAIEDSLVMLLEGASIKETAIRLAWALGIDPDKTYYERRPCDRESCRNGFHYVAVGKEDT